MAESTRPDSESGPRFAIPLASGAFVIVLGMCVPIGCHLGIEPLTRIRTDMVSMKPATALAFVLSGCALCLMSDGKNVSRFAVVLSIAVVAIGGSTFVATPMRPTTSFAFVMIGLASILLAIDRQLRAARCLVLLASVVTGALLLASGYGVRTFIGLPDNYQMSQHASLGLLVLSSGLMLSRPKREMIVSITNNGRSRVMDRWLLPVAALAPIVVFGLSFRWQCLGILDARFGAVVLVTLIVVAFVAAIWRVAHSLYGMDQERHRFHAERIEGERRFHILADSMAQIVWTSRANGDFQYLNRRWYEYTGLDPASQALAWRSVPHPHDLGLLLDQWQKALLMGQGFQGEFRFRRSDHTYRWHLVRVDPLRDAAGCVVQWVGTATDVDTQMRMSEQRYRTLLEATTAIVWNATADGSVDSDQPGWTAFTGQTYDELKGWGWLAAFHPGDRERIAESWAAAMHARTTYQTKCRLLRADGEYRHMCVNALPLVDDGGIVREWIGVHIDVDEQVRAHEAMKEAKDAAEAASRAKAEFLANMSHEIRTPMNGVLGMAELALATDLNPRQREYVGIVKSSAESLLVIIDDILDFSKIEAGKLTLDFISCGLREVVDETLRCLASKAHEKRIELACRVAPEVPERVVGDPGRLRQVLVNLVGNAIKFTQQGEVVVTVECSIDADLNPTLCFSVADTGIGVAPEKRASIFDAFQQADGSTTRKYGGTGLGLTISARLIELMNGRIWLDENPCGGSIFRFSVPLNAADEEQLAAVDANLILLNGLRVLIVDDNKTNRMILDEILSQWGCRPLSVENGHQAILELDRAAARGEPYIIALLDFMMPEMDGYQLARRIRSSAQHAGTRLLMLTSGGPDDQLASGETPIDGRLNKPVRQSDLLNAMLDLLGPMRSPSGARTNAQTKPVTQSAFKKVPTGRQLRVLLAEDHQVNQKVVTWMLENQGHQVVVAGNGRLAVEQFLSSRPFDVIFMDIQMPEMDGFEAAALIRAHTQPDYRPVPIVALTAHAMAGDRERCLEADFDDYLSKPIQADALAAVLTRILDKFRAQTSERQPPAEVSLAFQTDAALDALDGNQELLIEILLHFINYIPGFMTDAREAINVGDSPELARMAHALIGAAAQVTAARVVGSALKLEQFARCADLTRAKTALCDLAREFENFRAALDQSNLAPAIKASRDSLQLNPISSGLCGTPKNAPSHD